MMSRHYPIMVDLLGRRCLVVGGGPVAERKVLALVERGAEIVVVSPSLSPGLEDLKRQGRIVHRARPYKPGDLPGSFLVFGATDDPEVNGRLADEAKAAGVLANLADSPSLSTFLVPAVLTRGNLVIAISTGGDSPRLARKIREDLESVYGVYGDEYAELLKVLGRVRERAMREVADPGRRRALLERAIEADLLTLIRTGDALGVERTVRGLFDESPHMMKQSR
ncbi:MAG: bifunctional precorrin-2 dehydrogenase/sirohydrochlorin ferrochelatase [candidate division NC10 bacterium]|nr:bifunctional precorrin-2 dehydrogenase/sirohydrochlorin ferrochelatase [candidate division NC10 bacterium]